MDYKELSRGLSVISKYEKRRQYNEINVGNVMEQAATAITDLLARAEAAEAAQATLQRAMAEYKARAEKAEMERDELFNLLDDTCKDVRERHVDDSVCGLCEYDGVHSSESGDCVNECPGFDIDDCFCMKKSIQEKYGQKEE